jgi:hypothetical protein
VTSTSSAQPSIETTEEDIAFWTLFRHVYGLEEDRAWVLNVANDPSATRHSFGVPMLARERAQVAQANASGQNLVPAANRFAAEFEGFAGLWLENQLLVIAFADQASAREAEARRLFGPLVDVRPARHSLRELRGFMQQLRSDAEWFMGVDVEVIDVSLNEALNGVNLYYRAPSATVETLIRQRYEEPDWLVPEWAGARPWTGPWGDLQLTVVHTNGQPVDGSFVLHPLDPGSTAFGPAFLEAGKFANAGMAAIDWIVEINYVVDGVQRQINRAFTIPADDVVKVHIIVDD